MELEGEINGETVVGITRPQTMKLVGEINGETMIILIDSGATNNFVSTSLVRLNLPITTCPNFGVVLGRGHEVVGTANAETSYCPSKGYPLLLICGY